MGKNLKKMSCAICVGLLAIHSAVRASSMEDVVVSFSACDAAMFNVLKKYSAELASDLALNVSDDLAFIPVPDRSKSGQNTVRFKESIPAFGVRLTGYFDEVTSPDPSQKFLFWGFFTSSLPDETVRNLSPHLVDANRLRKDDEGAFVRLEMLDGKSWKKIGNPAADHGLPGKAVERIFIIDKSDDPAYSGTRVACSLQGPLSMAIQRELRPDIR